MMIGYMVVQVTATTKFLIALATLVGVNRPTKLGRMLATHMHGPGTALHALTLPVAKGTLSASRQGYHYVPVECLTPRVVVLDRGLATVHQIAVANTNIHILNKAGHILKLVLN
jgi:hypothetical protein